MFSACFFLFLPTSLFPRCVNRHSQNVIRRAFSRIEALPCQFSESAPGKNEGKTPKFRPIFAPNRNILNAVTRNEEEK